MSHSRGANGRRGGPTEGVSRSRAPADVPKGSSNGRAAGRRSLEHRSSSSRSSSSAGSSSAADSDSPRKRRRARDRRFDRYEDSDAERAARRTRRPRPLASVKDILAKTGDQPAFRSNKTPVKLTLSKNRVTPLTLLLYFTYKYVRNQYVQYVTLKYEHNIHIKLWLYSYTSSRSVQYTYLL